jgi:hypothetical protein
MLALRCKSVDFGAGKGPDEFLVVMKYRFETQMGRRRMPAFSLKRQGASLKRQRASLLSGKRQNTRLCWTATTRRKRRSRGEEPPEFLWGDQMAGRGLSHFPLKSKPMAQKPD